MLAGGRRGGSYRWKPTELVNTFMLTTETWLAEPSLKDPRSEHACFAIGGKIYVVAGVSTDGKNLRTIEVLDLTSERKIGPDG